MKKEEFKKDMILLKEKAPHVYNDVVYITSPFYRVYNELYGLTIQLLDKDYNLTMNELDIITSLFYSGDENYALSPTKLTERLLFSSGGMTKILKKLETKKLVTREENENDGRSKLVQLTEKGLELAQEGLKNLFLFEEKYFANLNNEEQKQLSTLLLKSLKA